MMQMLCAVLFVFAASFPDCASAASNAYMTYHWHMQQPIYWPAPSFSDPNTYQKAYESIQAASRQGGHPRNDVASIFSKSDRVNDYTGTYPAGAVDACSAFPDMGAQVSYSGCLIENVESLAAASAYGYSPGWSDKYVSARQQATSGGFPKLDLVGFTYHHALMPLVDRAAFAMELAIHKVVYAATWGPSPGYSKGFFPAEMAFTERQIPALVEAGFEWVIVPNSHLSRACKDYPYTFPGDNNDPPNAADAVNPAFSDASYFNESISRGCTPKNAVPFAFKPHYAQHVDPATGKVSRIIVVPAANAMGWQDGYACYSTNDMEKVLSMNSSEPLLFLLAHDGDNSFGGGNAYYTQCVPNLVKAAAAANISPTTIQQYLTDHPVAADDVVHVEDGAWVNADGDFGAPNVVNWDVPPLPKTRVYPDQLFDIPSGWSDRSRQWGLITAALNAVLTAEQMSGGVNVTEVQKPTAAATSAELAWHFFLPSLTSGYMYYGTSLDLQEKSTVACNAAVTHAQAAMTQAGPTASDTTPPSIWTLQRQPWNPGGVGFGALYEYKPTAFNNSDWYVWTFVGDVSGVQNATLYYRTDADGVNPITDAANEVYDPASMGLGGVSAWTAVPMTQRTFPKGNFFNQTIDFTCDATAKPCYPTLMADEYYVKVTGVTGLLDYYVEAADVNGNSAKSDIYHVFVNSTSGDM